MSARDRFLSLVRKYQFDPERPGSDAFWSPGLEAIPREQLRAIQEEKLVAAYDYLYADSPYYRKRFDAAGLGPGAVRSLADLAKIPVTRKVDWISDIEEHAPWGTFSPLDSERWQGGAGWMVFSTSGTTRQPRVFRHTSHDQEIWAWLCARALWSYGVRPGQMALNCFFYGPSVAAWGMHHGLNLVGCPVIPGGSMNTERRILFIKMMRPAVLLGTPSTLLTLGRRMEDMGDDPSSFGVQTLVCAGEPGAAVWASKKRLEELWGARVHDDFGCTEVAMAPLGYTCQYEASKTQGPVGVHLMEDSHIIEVLDPETLQPVAPGERGTLVVTNLFSEAAPFLRYDMGDWVAVDETPCPCGRTHARAVGGLAGRNDHCLKIKGLQFFPSTFEDALRSIEGIGDEYRIEVYAQYREGLRIVPQANAYDHDERRYHRDEVHIVVERAVEGGLSAHEIATRLRGILGISVKVELLEPGSLPRTEGKGTRFFDKRGEYR